MNKYQLIEKILKARLTPEEGAEMIQYIEKIKSNRPQPSDSPSED